MSRNSLKSLRAESGDLKSAKKYLEKLSRIMRRSTKDGDMIVVYYIGQGIKSIGLEIGDYLNANSKTNDLLIKTAKMQELNLKRSIGTELYDWLEEVTKDS